MRNRKLLIFFWIALFSISLHAVEIDRFVEVIPADVDYENEYVEEFSSKVYDLIQDAIANYIYKQKRVEDLYKVKENTLPQRKFSKRTEKFNEEIRKDAGAYMKRRGLDRLIVFDFSSKAVSSRLHKCKKRCALNVTVDFYSYDKQRQRLQKERQKWKLMYDVTTGLFANDSIKSVRDKTSKFLIQK